MRSLRVLIAMFVLLFASRASAAQKVMLCIADTAIGPDLKTRLTGTGLFASVDWVNCGATTPSLTTLKTYDAVLVTANGGFVDRTTLGNNLADYVDAGGHVVQTMFAMFTDTALLGRWATDGYSCIGTGAIATSSSFKTTPNEPSHPLVFGVSGLTANNRGTGALNAARGAVSVWDYNDGRSGICRMTIGGAPRVDLNFLPSPGASFDKTAGDLTKIVSNALLYTAGPRLVASPASLTFSTPSAPVNATLTVRNAGAGALSVSAASIVVGAADFAIVSSTFPMALASGASATLTIRFAPSTMGTRAGLLSLTSDDPSGPLAVALNGTSGPPTITLDKTALTFASTAVGATSGSITLTVRNSGLTPLTVSSLPITGANSGDFAITTTLPGTVAPGASSTINATFSPSAAGMRTAVLTIGSDDPSSPTKVVDLAGTGATVDAGIDAADTAVADAALETTVDSSASDTTVAVDSNVEDSALADTTAEDTAVADTAVQPDTSAAADTSAADADVTPAAPTTDDEGCGCATVGRGADRTAAFALVALLLAARRGRRRAG